MEKYRDKYLDYKLKVEGITPGHAKVVSIHLAKLFKFLEEKGVKDVKEVERWHLEEFQEGVMKRDIAFGTKRDILSSVVLFFRYFHDYDYISEDPALVIEPVKKERRIPRSIMNEEEIKYLLTLPNRANLLGMRDICIMKLHYSSAMRPKEIFNLRLNDVDFRRHQAVVRRPKNRRDRIVYFDRYTAELLEQYIEKARPWLLEGRALDNLFLAPKKDSLTTAAWAMYFTRKYAPLLKKKFKKHITPYAFRHTSATHWLDSGTRQKRDVLPYIQRQLGHESLESTAIYTHVAIESLREIFRKYHPREIAFKNLHKVPSPDDIISPLDDDKK